MRHLTSALFVFALAATAAAQQPQPQPQPQAVQEQQPQEEPVRPGEMRPVRTAGSEYHPILSAPARTLRSQGFSSLVLVPEMEPAYAIAAGELWASAAMEYSSIDFDENGTVFEGALLEEVVELRYGLAKNVEGWLRLSLGSFDEDRDTTVVDNGAVILSGRDPGFDAGDAVFGAKYVYGEYQYVDAGLAAFVKVPLASEEDLLDGGTTDFGLALLASKTYGSVAVHANAGVVVPIRDAEVFNTDVDLNTFFHWGLGGVYRITPDYSASLQFEGNTDPFDKISDLQGTPMTLTGGFRGRIYAQTTFVNASVGLGLTDEASDWTLSVGLNHKL